MQLYAFKGPSRHFPSITSQPKHRSPHPPPFLIGWTGAIGLLFVLLVVSVGARAQTALTPLEQHTLSSFNPAAKTFSSVTLSGATTWTAGSLQDSGSVVFKVSSDGSSSETWSLATQPHSITNTSFSDGRTCSSVDSVGKSHQIASSGCFRAVPWFAPWMSLLMLSNNVLLRTSGISFKGEVGADAQLQYMTNLGGTVITNSAVLSGTAVGLILDPKTSFVNEMDFDESIDSDPARVISNRIVFSDYRTDSGLVLPHHIQRYIQHTLQADITITNITAE